MKWKVLWTKYCEKELPKPSLRAIWESYVTCNVAAKQPDPTSSAISLYMVNNDKNKNKSSIWAFFLSNSSCLIMSINYTSLLIFSCPRSSVPSLLIDSRFIVQSDRCGNQMTSKFLTQASWRLYEIMHPPTCLCSTSNFHTYDHWDFQACHKGRYLAITSRAKYHRYVRQDRHYCHLNLIFQVTCAGQLSQFLRCFVLLWCYT